MPRTIPNADRQAAVTESRPPESSPDPTPGDHPHPPGPADEQPPRDSRASISEAAEGRRERSAARRRPRPAWLDASTVIGSLIGLIGLLIVFTVSYGINSMNNRFDDMRVYIDARFDAQDAAIDARFAVGDERFAAIDARLDAVESEIKGLRQDVNDINYRLDLLIALLEAAEVIPEDVVPKSSTEALATVDGPVTRVANDLVAEAHKAR